MGEVRVRRTTCGRPTQRSFQNFAIGTETMPEGIIRPLPLLKKAAALANRDNGKLDEARCGLITAACDQILAGRWPGEFPLKVWQTGSGTQSNMNVNEVIAHLCAPAGPGPAGPPQRPREHVPVLQRHLPHRPPRRRRPGHPGAGPPALGRLRDTLARLEAENWEVVKSWPHPPPGRGAHPLRPGDQRLAGHGGGMRRDAGRSPAAPGGPGPGGHRRGHGAQLSCGL